MAASSLVKSFLVLLTASALITEEIDRSVSFLAPLLDNFAEAFALDFHLVANILHKKRCLAIAHLSF